MERTLVPKRTQQKAIAAIRSGTFFTSTDDSPAKAQICARKTGFSNPVFLDSSARFRHARARIPDDHDRRALDNSI